MLQSKPMRCLSVSILLFFFNTITLASNPSISSFKYSWLERALKLQREIDFNAPLKDATFLGTHNSYNAKSYAIPLVRYIDPNQILSIYDQLEMGIRSLEFDIHWTNDDKLQKNILLCHAKGDHIGCSLYDRPIQQGLEELRTWLKENPGEIVLLYLDRYLDGHEPRLISLIENTLGELIYPASLSRKNHDDPKSCVALPSTLTKADIVKAKKQVIIVTKACDGRNPRYEEQDKFTLRWNDYVYAGIGDVPQYPYSFIDATLNDFTDYPDCGLSKIFHPDIQHTSLWRIFEDRTSLASTRGNQKKLEADDMRKLMQCGINWPSIDMLSSNDERLNASIWSWAPTYPQDGNGQCAMYKKDEGIKNMPCTQSLSGFACRNETTQEIKAISMIGSWSSGESTCQVLGGKSWHFFMPYNGYQLTQLKESMTIPLLQEIWVNYIADTNGNWHANKITLRA